MRKKGLVLGLVVASCVFVGCSNTKNVDKAQESKTENNQEQEKEETEQDGANGETNDEATQEEVRPGDPNEDTEGAPEPEEKTLEESVAWVQDSLNKYVEAKTHGYKQVNSVELEDGTKREEVLTATIDSGNGLIYTKNEFGGEDTIQEYFEKVKDGNVYYYSQDFKTKEMNRTKSSEDDFNRALDLSNNVISLENQKVVVGKEVDFEGKKAVEVLVKSDNEEMTIFSVFEDLITEEKMKADSSYKAMVEKSKTSQNEYKLYFDSTTKALVGMSVDNTISDYFNNYEVEKIKSSTTTITYCVDDECEKVTLPTEFKEV